MDPLYNLVACCGAFFFLAVCGGLLGGGAAILNSADVIDYRAANCFVSSFTYTNSSESSSRRRRSGSRRRPRRLRNSGYCDYQLETSLTQNRSFPWFGKCTHFAEEVHNCQIAPPLNCSDTCYVVYESEAADSAPIEVTMASAEIFGTFLGLVLTAMGSMSFCLSCACCFCIRLMSFSGSGQGQSLKGSVEPSNIGISEADDDYRRPAIDTEKYERAMAGCFSFTGTLLTFFGVVGVIGGTYIAAVLSYFYNRELTIAGTELPAEAAAVGAGISGFCVFGIVLVWLGICLSKSKFKQLMKYFASNSNSEEEMQRLIAQKLIDGLRSDKGERMRKLLLEAGIGEDQMQLVLTSPPEQMLDVVMQIMTGRVMAHVVCTIYEGGVRPQFESNLAIFATTFLGPPALLVTIVLQVSAYCVAFEPPVLASTVFLLMVLSCGALYLQWLKTYTVVFSALYVVFSGAIFALWVQLGATPLSILLWLQSIPLFGAWLLLTSIWSCYLKPVAEALFELCLEQLKVVIWHGCGCERDPEHLRQRREDVVSAGGCLAEKLGLRQLVIAVSSE